VLGLPVATPWATIEANQRLFIPNPALAQPVRGSSFLVPMKPFDLQSLLELFDKSTGITTDTRECGPGMLFFALRGERFNGNAFAQKALDAGCLAAIIDDTTLQGTSFFLVDDVLAALQQLARCHRNRFSGPVFGLTGSNGKTTTKELLRAVLSQKFKVYATKGNLNNHIGVPLTLLSMPQDVEFALVEMGANHQGEIAELAKIANPNYGMITNVGHAHLEGFGGIEGVKKGKQELFVHLAAEHGHAFVPSADSDLVALANVDGLQRIEFGTREHPPLVWRAGEDPQSPVCWSLDGSNNAGPWHVNGRPTPVQLEGRHQLANMTAAIAVGHHFGVSQEEIGDALEKFQPVSQRGETVQTEQNVVVVDCYNANPSSVESTLRSFAAARHKAPLAILGDMLELGEYAAQGHQLVREVCRECTMECWVVGPQFKEHAQGDFTFQNLEDLQDHLVAHPLQGRTILLKGSRSMQLERLVAAL
jgi:UDP-N-acetylmuramoyl-tripeptide--D-alanyl-D-alanine ligase